MRASLGFEASVIDLPTITKSAPGAAPRFAPPWAPTPGEKIKQFFPTIDLVSAIFPGDFAETTTPTAPQSLALAANVL